MFLWTRESVSNPGASLVVDLLKHGRVEDPVRLGVLLGVYI